MTTLDNVIDLGIVTDGSAVSRAGFGTTMFADSASMTERVRVYDALPATKPGDITQWQWDALVLAFGQDIAPARLLVGRVDFTRAPQVTTVTVTDNTESTYTVTINGTDYTHTPSGGGETTDQIATSIAALIDVDALVGASAAGSVVTITALSSGVAFTWAESDGLDAVLTTASGETAAELDALASANGSWFGLALPPQTEQVSGEIAAWNLGRGKLAFLQTSRRSVVNNMPNNIGAQLVAAAYDETRLHWYSDDTVPWAAALLARYLAVDPDIDTTQVDYIQIKGVAPDDDNLSDTQLANLVGLRCGVCLTFGGVAVAGGGNRMASGRFVDVHLTVNWLRSRAFEAIAQTFIDQAALGSKVSFTDRGFEGIVDAVFGVLEDGINAGHFESNEDAAPYARATRRSSLTEAQVGARCMELEFGAPLAGGVLSVKGRGVVSDDFELIAQLALAG